MPNEMTFQYSRRIYLGDTDAAGVVYFAKGMEICHQAYEESLATSQISLQQMLEEKQNALPIVRAEIDFLRPLFCGDRIFVNLIGKLSNTTEFALDYQIYSSESNKPAVVAQTRHVCIDPHQRNRIELPPSILQWLETIA